MQQATAKATVRDSAPLLRVTNVVKRFGGFTAVDRLSLDIVAGEFFALLGPSGCGKTTLLRMLAGFETPDSGEIFLNGENIAQVPPHLRPVNMMFQNYALFPHLSVAGNIAFGLRRANLPEADVEARVREMVALVRLEGLERRKPDQLSGGQRQRVALARALARRPQMLLLDEPLAALDKKLREITQMELLDVQKKLGTTFIVVTHDQDEAMTLASRIGVMDRGRLVQIATPRELYEAPNSRWVAGFVGDINMLEGKISALHRDLGRITVTTAGAGVVIAAHTQAVGVGDEVCVAVRPEKVTLAAGDSAAGTNSLAGTLIETSYLGSVSTSKVRLDSGATLRVTRANAAGAIHQNIPTGTRVIATFAPDDCVVLDR